MKVLTRQLIVCFLALFFLAPTVYAGDVELRSILFKQQPPSANNDLVVFFGASIVNNTGSTIKGKLIGDLTYCAKPGSHKLAFTMASHSIPAGDSYRVEGYFVPKDEQSIRFRFLIDGNAQPAVEKTIPRAKYDSLGAELHRCKKMKKMVTPQMTVPPKSLKVIRK